MNIKRFLRQIDAQMYRRQPVRSPRSSRNYKGKNQDKPDEEVFITQIAVCTILIISILGISKLNNDFSIAMKDRLKTAITKQTSVEAMKNSAEKSLNQAGGWKDFFSGLFKKNKDKEIDEINETFVPEVEINDLNEPENLTGTTPSTAPEEESGETLENTEPISANLEEELEGKGEALTAVTEQID